MTKRRKRDLIFLLLLFLPVCVVGDTHYYYDSTGKMTGWRSSSYGGWMYYYNADGTLRRQQRKSRDATFYYDAKGILTGSAYRFPGREATTRYYDARGNLLRTKVSPKIPLPVSRIVKREQVRNSPDTSSKRTKSQEEPLPDGQWGGWKMPSSEDACPKENTENFFLR